MGASSPLNSKRPGADAAARPGELPVEQEVVGEPLVVGEDIEVVVDLPGRLRDVDGDADRLHPNLLLIAIPARAVP
jgi:hypothetical protein